MRGGAEMERKHAMIKGKRKGAQGLGALHYGAFDSPIGTVYVAVAGKKVAALSFTSADEADFLEDLSSLVRGPVSRSDAIVRPIIRELREYFDGKRKRFTFSPAIRGRTRFQERALKAALSIEYGETRTYGWLAERAGSPRAARAAGQVMAQNSAPIIIPCHRVIGSDGGLCGFAGGLKAFEIKRKLLEIEGVRI